MLETLSLLPVLPILYAGMAAAMMFLPGGLRAGGDRAPSCRTRRRELLEPAPTRSRPENNLAWTDFVRVQSTAARYLERRYPGARIAAAWPLAPALAEPSFRLCKPAARRQDAARPGRPKRSTHWIGAKPRLLALFSHSWDPAWNYFRWPPVRRLRMRFWDYREDITPLEVQAHLPLQLVARLVARRLVGGDLRMGRGRGPATGPRP